MVVGLIGFASNTEQVMEAATHKAPAVWPPTTHPEDYQN